MQTAIGESTYPVMSSMKWQKHLPRLDLLAAGLVRRLPRAAAVRRPPGADELRDLPGVMALFGAVHAAGPGGLGPVLALPAAALTGLAFAAPVVAWAVTQDRDTGFSVVFRFVMIPLFLFSGTFFPVTQLPAVIRAPGVRHAAVARRRPVPRTGARDRDRGLGAAAPGVPARRGRRRRSGTAPHTFRRRLNPLGREPDDDRRSVFPATCPADPPAAGPPRLRPDGRRQGRGPGRAQPDGLPPAVADHGLRVLRARVLPAVDRRGPGQADRRDRTACRTPTTSPPACSRSRR